ncbi:MAG: hypothetical protein ACKV19_09025 [Verrucomicrobiales bacterium]
MNKKRIFLLVGLFLLLVVGWVVWQMRPVPAALRLTLTGTAGLKVAGTVVVDGVSNQFSGSLPTNITVVARTFDYTIMMQEPGGELHGELKVGDDVYGSSSIASDFAGVRGGYERFWGGQAGGVMTTHNKGDRP